MILNIYQFSSYHFLFLCAMLLEKLNHILVTFSRCVIQRRLARVGRLLCILLSFLAIFPGRDRIRQQRPAEARCPFHLIIIYGAVFIPPCRIISPAFGTGTCCRRYFRATNGTYVWGCHGVVDTLQWVALTPSSSAAKPCSHPKPSLSGSLLHPSRLRLSLCRSPCSSSRSRE